MKFFSILKKDLLLLLRDRGEMIVLFLMPLAFILPVSFALGSGDGYGVNRDNQMIPLPIVNYDQGPRAQELLTAVGESLRLEIEVEPEQLARLGLLDEPECAPLSDSGSAYTAAVQGEESEDTTVQTTTPEMTASAGETPASVPETLPAASATPLSDQEGMLENGALFSPACEEKAVLAMLQESRRSAALIIPPGFSENLDAGRKTWVTLLYDPTSDPARLQQIEGVVKGSTIQVSLKYQVSRGMEFMTDLSMFAPEHLRVEVEKQAAQPADADQQPAIRLAKVGPSSGEGLAIPDTYQQTIPGYTVMFVFFIVTSLTASIHMERLNGTFRRLLSMPVTRFEMVLGKFTASLIVGMVQVIILFGVGALLFGLNLGRDLPALFLLTVALVAVAVSFGLAVAATGSSGSGLGVLLVISALLGGSMFPLDLMPPAMRALSYLVPHSWAISGYQDLMVRGQDISGILTNIGVLLVFAVVFFWFAVRRLTYEE